MVKKYELICHEVDGIVEYSLYSITYFFFGLFSIRKLEIYTQTSSHVMSYIISNWRTNDLDK